MTTLRIAGVYTGTCDSIPLSHQIQRIYESRLKGHVYPADPRVGQAFVHRDDTVEAIVAAGMVSSLQGDPQGWYRGHGLGDAPPS